MKIAIFASNTGDKAIHLHDFFKEGNRLTVDLLITDNTDAPVAEKMKSEGITVMCLDPDISGPQLAEMLRDRDIELIVVDDFNGDIPVEIEEAYGKAVVYPTSAQSAPLDVITTVDKINAALNNQHKETHGTPDSKDGAESGNEPSGIDREWAEVLHVDIDNDPLPPLEPEQHTEQEEQSPQGTPPPYYDNPVPENPEPPQYNPQPPFYPGQQPPLNLQKPQPPMQNEPMPETYLVWSVVITILCCLIPGIVAIVYSASVSSKYYAGDIAGAKRASRNAQIWCIISIVAGILWATIYLPLSLLGL